MCSNCLPVRSKPSEVNKPESASYNTSFNLLPLFCTERTLGAVTYTHAAGSSICLTMLSHFTSISSQYCSFRNCLARWRMVSPSRSAASRLEGRWCFCPWLAASATPWMLAAPLQRQPFDAPWPSWCCLLHRCCLLQLCSLLHPRRQRRPASAWVRQRSR